MTTKLECEEWWPVLALSGGSYAMSVHEAKGLLKQLVKCRPTAKQWGDGRFEERGQASFLDMAITTIREEIMYEHPDDVCCLDLTIGEIFAIYLALAGKSNWAMRFLPSGTYSLMKCFHRALFQISEGATPKDAKEIFDNQIEPWLLRIKKDFNLVAEKEKAE